MNNRHTIMWVRDKSRGHILEDLEEESGIKNGPWGVWRGILFCLCMEKKKGLRKRKRNVIAKTSRGRSSLRPILVLDQCHQESLSPSLSPAFSVLASFPPHVGNMASRNSRLVPICSAVRWVGRLLVWEWRFHAGDKFERFKIKV